MKPKQIAFITFIALFAAAFTTNANADGFTDISKPIFEDIEPRQVYGQATYDVSFIGNKPSEKSESAKSFLSSIVHSKFGGSKGNYIVTLVVGIDGRTVVTEPLISANWENEKFLFITTSEKESIVVNRAGVLLDNLVIDNVTNKVTLSLKAYYSKNSSVDLSLFKEISDLSKTATISAFAPGIAGVATALQPFVGILGRLLSNYREETIVENTVGAFTLLDEGFANVLNYKTGRISVNIYLKTENSQLPRNMAMGKFKDTSPDAVLATVASGVGAARGTVLDIIRNDNDAGNQNMKAFVQAITNGTPLAAGYAVANIRPQCEALKARANKLVSTRDASLFYWAYLKNHGTEVMRYTDGKKCGDSALTESMKRVGLELGPEWQ